MFRRTKELSMCLVMIVCFMAVGCASLGGKMVTPETTEEKLAYAEATLTGLTLTATQLNDAHLITLEQAKETENLITKVELALRLGRVALNGKDDKTALDQLITIQSFLLELNTFVESKRDAYLTRPLPPISVEGEPKPLEEEPS